LKQLETQKEKAKKIEVLITTLAAANAKSAKPTIMHAVLIVLREARNGMTALEILDEINSRYFEGKILRTSLSPQLSRLKDRDRKIILRGNRWYLTDEEPPLFASKK
jgi:hypothetical protein